MSPNPRPGCTAETSADDIGWQDDAACRGADPDLFFAPDVESVTARERREARAKRVCSRCPVAEACLEWRLGFEHQRDAGIWGAMNEDERWWLRKNRLRTERRKAS